MLMTRPLTNAFAATLAATFIALAATSAAEAADLQILGETKYEAHQLVRLRVDNVDPKAAILWRVNPSKGVEKAASPRGTLQFVAHPGKYQVEVLVISQTEECGLQVQEAFVNVEIEGCQHVPPDTNPNPNPNPKPNPNPPGGGAGKLDPVNAIGRIRFGNAGCTATVIGPRRADGRWDVLTAAHCVSGVGARGQMQLKDGRQIGITAVVHERGADICWCTTDQQYDDLPYANVAKSNPPAGTPIWHMGYGVDRPGNREDGVVLVPEDASGQTKMELNVSSGDSGGGIFRSDTNEVISTVCCTKAPGRRIDVWGCSAERINAARLRVAAAANEWIPVDIPVCREGVDRTGTSDEWNPIEIPVRETPAAKENEKEGEAEAKATGEDTKEKSAEPAKPVAKEKVASQPSPCSKVCVCGCNASQACRCPRSPAGYYPPVGPATMHLYQPVRFNAFGGPSGGITTGFVPRYQAAPPANC